MAASKASTDRRRMGGSGSGRGESTAGPIGPPAGGEYHAGARLALTPRPPLPLWERGPGGEGQPCYDLSELFRPVPNSSDPLTVAIPFYKGHAYLRLAIESV